MKTKWILFCLVVAALGGGLWFWNSRADTSELGTSAFLLTEKILSFGPRPAGSEGLEKAREHMKQELEAAGWAVQFQDFERGTPVGKIKFRNLRARLKNGGEDPWQRKIAGLLCAHLDSKYYREIDFLAADDAASACAAVVEIGKWLSREKPAHAENLELVLFDGEEAFARDMTILDGLYGSRFYANSWRGREDKPQFGIVLDMIGHKELSIRIPSDSPQNLSRLMFAAAEKEKASGYFSVAPNPIMDDHLPLNLVGIPTLDIIGDFTSKKWWHTPADNIDIISRESLDVSMRVTLLMLNELLDGK
ncbi:MAG: M28 family peptidase [Armatimonadetes bacterium]|nr:M28 family peptidase [Akkermansiaceae bacterium]